MNQEYFSATAISCVVPVYNEQDGLEEFYRRLVDSADKLRQTYEIVFVNDGSTDDTATVLRQLARRDDRVRVVELSRNFGHQLALTAGYDFACGRVVISLDGDCQHPPELISEMVARWREGFEVVYTVRKDTRGISRLRRAVGRCVYRVIGWASGAELTDQADFRLLDRKALDALTACREHGRFLRGLVRHIGFRQTCLTYVAEKRRKGKSNYTLRQLSAMAWAGVFNFSVAPLRMITAVGGLFALAAAIYLAGSLAAWPFDLSAGPSWHVAMFMLALFGMQFMALGIVGEYVARIFDQAKARPLYFVREKIGFEEPTSKNEPRKETTPGQDERSVSVYT